MARQKSDRDLRIRIPKKATRKNLRAAIDLILKERAVYWRTQLERAVGRGNTLTVPASIEKEVREILNQ